MGTTKSWFYGGHEVLTPSSGPVQLNYQRGRVKVVDPQAGGITVRLPETRDVPYAGFAVLLIVNVSGTNSLDVARASGATSGILGGTTIGTNQMAKVALTDRSTSDGEWILRIQNINEAVGPPPDYVVTVGGSVIADRDETRLFAPNGETWSLSTDTSINKFSPGCFREAGSAYASDPGGNHDEYTFDSWTSRTAPTVNSSPDDGSATVSGRGIHYHEATPTPQVEEYSRTGDSWASLNDVNHPSSQQSYLRKPGCQGRGDFAYLMWPDQSVAEADRFKEHDRSADTWTNSAVEAAMQGRPRSAHWVSGGGSDLHQAGGQDLGASSGDTDLHYRLDLDVQSAWVQETDVPVEVQGAAGHVYPGNAARALLVHGLYADSNPHTYRWDDVGQSFTSLTDPSSPNQAPMGASITSVPQ